LPELDAAAAAPDVERRRLGRRFGIGGSFVD
jgi:hypothetical protein